MAHVKVTVVPREGAKPRGFRLDDATDSGGSLIATLKRQLARGELASVEVAPFFDEPKPARAAKKATKAAEAPAAE